MSIGVSCASFPSIRDIDSRAKHVLLPLYIYPSAGAWNDVYSNITANPGKNFTIVVNPASGPGSSTYPVSDYVAGIAKLNSYSNTQVLGYVDTGYPQISTSTVNSQVAQYKKWASYSKADIHIDGIFFDDMDGTYTPQQYAYYQNISITTKITMGPGFQHVLFNPGAGVDSRYFALADEIIVFEDYYYNYNDDIPFNTPQQYWNKSSILIHHFNGTAARQQAIIDNLIGNHFQGLYISTTGDYDSTGTPLNSGVYEYISKLWTCFCNDMY